MIYNNCGKKGNQLTTLWAENKNWVTSGEKGDRW